MDGRLRVSIFYGLLFSVAGVNMPYIGLWFEDRGLSGADIGVILAAPMLARILAGPLLAVWADSFVLRRTPMIAMCAAGAVGYVLMGASQGFAAWLPIWLAANTALAAAVPLTDVLTLRLGRKEGFAFAIPRGAGSLAFIVANVAMGVILTMVSTEAILIWIVVTTALAALAARWILPPEPVYEGPRLDRADRFKGLGRLIGDPLFMTAITGMGMIQAAHAFYYGFSALVWKAQGIAESWVGLLWGVGVAAEIAFMWFMEPLRRRLGPYRMLMIGATGAIVRWTAMAFAPPLWLLWPLQMLHAVSFSAVFLAGLEVIERLSPRDTASAAQTLSASLSGGVLIGLATVLSGPLYDRHGSGGYFAMAALAALGALLVIRLKPVLARPA